ncbi:hypothetical protein IEQ34_015457 [Dendrobium chrysotoxum]|uniref:Uncharacterized protein n=1 Tax=Dendrobium chrysotoxum TaxID=161865 RepID=A0AAV7GGR8_DENCH|nr:hypothetical protein IEQ34_015457 [Dendrobium chrysotoxum]
MSSWNLAGSRDFFSPPSSSSQRNKALHEETINALLMPHHHMRKFDPTLQQYKILIDISMVKD